MEKEPEKGTDDLFVPLGNMSDSTLDHMRAILAREDPATTASYEAMVEDYIATFNHAVTQGVPPDWALFAFTQAYAITLGNALRADFPRKEAGNFVRTILENADFSNTLVRQVSTIIKPGKPS